ncbi:MAG: FAD:protein FMN transferase, partial [Bdellovibrionaceae bacterium]|nr:FAD:protein FMN transferase [Pseudobdellovibrionaceae bacterium]
DFGGIVKEYAVDKCLALLDAKAPATLINFGGDLAVNKAPQNSSWTVAIEEAFKGKIPGGSLELRSGALATSGDTHRFFEHKGVRYMHILNPKTGYPVANGVATVTVHADSCTMAGMLATISHLQKSPEQFLADQEVKHWVLRHKNNPLA